MKRRLPGLAFWFAAVAASTLAFVAAAQSVPYETLDPNAYQSFVANWTPASGPLCAVMESAAQWNRVMHPAPVMGANRQFAPPASFWAHHAVLFVARVVYSGETARVFDMRSVVRVAEAIDLRYTFAPTPHASSQMKWWLGVAVARPLPPEVRFVENGRVICLLHPAL